MIIITPVISKNELKQFIDFPHDLYADDANYVPELYITQRDMLTTGKHPSLKHLQLQLFLAKKGDEVVGRVAAIINRNYTEQVKKNEAFFGFFDTVKDYEVAEKLLEAVVNWHAEKGINKIIGPVNYTTNDPCGVLIDGFQHPPQVMTTYNKPYYKDYLEKYGFIKQMDLLSYWFGEYTIPERIMYLAKNIEKRLQRNGITIRTANLKNFAQEASSIKKIYNKAWDKNWGFVPFTDEEFDYVAKSMKLILDTDFTLVAEKNGEVIGFALALPNINQIQKNVRKGRLLPTGVFKLLFNKSKINSVRVITLGILEPYRTLGIEACFYTKITEAARRKKYTGAEASWILENNEMMNRELKNIGSAVYKTHRLYSMNIE
ncbi:MAG: hypothetical protein V4506_05820 [Bacteroidota bacterium]